VTFSVSRLIIVELTPLVRIATCKLNLDALFLKCPAS
jgi:hypothetical protein